MKIVHVVPTYLPATRYGGPIYSVHGLCRALAWRGHEVHVVTTSVDGPTDSQVPHDQAVALDGVLVHYSRSSQLRRLYFSAGLARDLERLVPEADVVHLHSVFLWPTLRAARVAARCGIPYVLAPRGMLVQDLIRRKNAWVKWAWIAAFERKNLTQAAALHLTSQVEADELRRFGFALPPLWVVPNGVDLPQHVRRPRPAEPPTILFLGRINWKKGLDRLLAALEHLPDARLLLAGNDEEGYLDEVWRLANSHEVRARVEYVGPISAKRRASLFARAHVVALCSYNENFGNVVLEAMAHACPVVVTHEVGASTLVQRWGAGVVVPGDPREIASALDRILSSPELQQEMGEAGRAVAVQRLSWDRIAHRLEEHYVTILRPPSSSVGPTRLGIGLGRTIPTLKLAQTLRTLDGVRQVARLVPARPRHVRTFLDRIIRPPWWAGRHRFQDVTAICRELAESGLLDRLERDLQYVSKSPAQPESARQAVPGTMHRAHLEALYVLVRLERPGRLVETGACNGASTAVLLRAMSLNGHGELWSIGPTEEVGAQHLTDLWPGKGGAQTPLGREREPGWLAKRTPWHLHLGRSQDLLPGLLAELGEIDLFLLDGGDSLSNQLFEFRTGLRHLSPGGALALNGINASEAFRFFWQELPPSTRVTFVGRSSCFVHMR